jgi:hypothetical protein
MAAIMAAGPVDEAASSAAVSEAALFMVPDKADGVGR